MCDGVSCSLFMYISLNVYVCLVTFFMRRMYADVVYIKHHILTHMGECIHVCMCFYTCARIEGGSQGPWVRH